MPAGLEHDFLPLPVGRKATSKDLPGGETLHALLSRRNPPVADIRAILERPLPGEESKRNVYAENSFKTHLDLPQPQHGCNHDSPVLALNCLVGQAVFSSMKEYVTLQALLNGKSYQE